MKLVYCESCSHFSGSDGFWTNANGECFHPENVAKINTPLKVELRLKRSYMVINAENNCVWYAEKGRKKK